jgi:protein gp37
MIDIEKGRYWDEGITLVDGCTPCSPGCDHCWSAAQAHRFEPCSRGPGLRTDRLTKTDGNFNGQIIIHPERLKRFYTHKPKVFSLWNDLFHEGVPDSFRRDTFDAIKQNQQHTFLILTKRPVIMAARAKLAGGFPSNVWSGLTVCNQQEADQKIPIFLGVPGKKFLSIEPMLSEMVIRKYLEDDCDCGICKLCNGQIKDRRMIDCVILGGETGPGARPLHPELVRSVRDQCAAAGVPFFFKQWGEWLDEEHINNMPDPLSPITIRNARCHIWPCRLRSFRMLKHKTGRLLDGYFHDDLPWVKP